ncbi:MAG: DUF1398 family protein [Rhodocyclaceae bacterium]|jgi:uncharacterized protein YbcV (DUF1398 family)
MDHATETLIRDTFAASNEGRIHFGEVVGRMIAAGVESYAVDYRAHRTTCYLANDEALTLHLDVEPAAIAPAFSAEGIRAAIRGAQQGIIMYPEFKRLSMQAGCIGYHAWIAGRCVVYHGRRGDTHLEPFPD